MPLEGHGTDCDCGCCDVEGGPQGQGQAEKFPSQEHAKCECPSCGRQSTAAGNMSCADINCPNCGATMKPAV